MIKHPFHIVDPRPWPLLRAIRVFLMVSGLVTYFTRGVKLLWIVGAFGLIITQLQWYRDIGREATFQGKHTRFVECGLRQGMILFIVSEICFFFSFFWAFFHASLNPNGDLGGWPPRGLQPIDPFEIPLLNTTLLLSRGVTITWAHIAILCSNSFEAHLSLALTVLLGALFRGIQLGEYIVGSFAISDSVFGSTFYVATGFHGLHVIIGTFFILYAWNRLLLGHFSMLHHFGFEARAWYWHFVDVVWLFLFICIYWWGY